MTCYNSVYYIIHISHRLTDIEKVNKNVLLPAKKLFYGHFFISTYNIIYAWKFIYYV